MSEVLRFPGLTTEGLHADLKPQVVIGTHDPHVAGGGDVELQPAFLCSPQPPGLQQEEVCIPEGKKRSQAGGGEYANQTER